MLINEAQYDGFCETFFWGFRGEPFNTVSSLYAVVCAGYLARRVYLASEKRAISSTRAACLCMLFSALVVNGISSALYHSFLYHTFGLMDTFSMTLGAWCALAMTTMQLFDLFRKDKAALAVLFLTSTTLLFAFCFCVTLLVYNVDALPIAFAIPNGASFVVLFAHRILARKLETAERSRRRVRDTLIASILAGVAALSWFETESRCQNDRSLAKYLWWGHMMFHVAVYSAYTLIAITIIKLPRLAPSSPLAPESRIGPATPATLQSESRIDFVGADVAV